MNDNSDRIILAGWVAMLIAGIASLAFTGWCIYELVTWVTSK